MSDGRRVTPFARVACLLLAVGLGGLLWGAKISVLPGNR